MINRIEISHRTVFFITGFLALLWALYQIREVIILLFVAIIFMSALSPLVEYLEKRRVPKVLAVAAVYIVIVALIGTLVSVIITPFIVQTTNLTQTLPQTLDKVFPSTLFDRSLLQQQLNEFSQNLFSFTLTVFNQVLALISVAVLSFYLLLSRDKVDDLIAQLFIRHENQVRKIVFRIEDKLGSWLRGQIVLSFIIGVLVYILLFALQVPYALPLSLFAALLEVVPVIGPIVSAIPAVLVAYLSGSFVWIIVAIGYFIIQELEAHIIVPQVMKKAVGLNPLVVILAVAIGGKLLGIAGGLLAVPITVVLQLLVEEIVQEGYFTEDKIA